MAAPERFAESQILFPCNAGAVHTWPEGDLPRTQCHDRYRVKSGLKVISKCCAYFFVEQADYFAWGALWHTGGKTAPGPSLGEPGASWGRAFVPG
jgi:hypothetical protein